MDSLIIESDDISTTSTSSDEEKSSADEEYKPKDFSKEYINHIPRFVSLDSSMFII